VRRLLNRVFSSASETEDTLSYPFLPPNLSLDDTKQRAVIGFLARKIAHRLKQGDADSLFYLSFSKNSFEYPDKLADQDFSIYLAHLMVNWVKQGEQLEIKAKELNLSSKWENGFIEIYQEFREELTDNRPLVQGENLVKGVQPTIPQLDDNEITELKEWEVYRDVMYALTQKKFLLISRAEVESYKTGQILCEGEIKVRSDIPKCRDRAKESLQQLGFDLSTIMGWMLMISEAITNILKHAEEGKMMVVEDHGIVRVIVEDKGPGFSLKDLPNTTLMAGYSTKKSLGQGFTLMMKMTEQVLLYTSKRGSTIVLILTKKEGES
jgi:anti-sigma regulatory factor (Ser/Thr protein kinase)